MPSNFLSRFGHNQSASVLVEFAVALPVLLILYFGTYELANFMLLRQKLESAGSQMLDILTQQADASGSDMDKIASTFHAMLVPYQPGRSALIFTHIVKPIDNGNPGKDCAPVTGWQYRWNDEGNARGGASLISGGKYSKADIGEIKLEPGDSVMAVEVLAMYRPVNRIPFVRKLVDGYYQYAFSYGHTRYGSFDYDPYTGELVNPPCI